MDFVLCSKGATKLFKYRLYELSHFEIKFSFPTIFVYTEKFKKNTVIFGLPPPLSCQAHPLNLQTVQAPLFSQSSPLYWFFVNPP